MIAEEPDPNKLMSKKEIAEEIGVSLRTIDRYIQQRKFPEPSVRLSRKVIRWRRRDIELWLQGKNKRGEDPCF